MKKLTLLGLILLVLSLKVTAQSHCSIRFGAITDTTNTAQFFDSVYVHGTTSPEYYKWYFGDGDSDTVRTPMHTYAHPGAYTVCVYIEDSLKTCATHFCRTIVVGAHKCNALWGAHTDTTLTAVFSDSSILTGHVKEYYYWTFDDGSSDTSRNPTHVYKYASTYRVCLYIRDSLSLCSSGYCNTITVGRIGSKYCNAYFTYHADTSHTASFYDSSYTLSSRTSYYWSFGDSAFSSSKNVSHTYTTAGVYYVCEYIYDSSTGCTSTYCKAITVGTTCTNYFVTYTDTTLTARFYDTISGGLHARHTWYYGDSTTGTGATPTHTYARAGSYHVTEVVYDSTNHCISSNWAVIHVGGYIYTPCTARFTVDSIDTAKKIIYISNHSTPGSLTSWAFGDGDSSSLATPTHTYSSTGTYKLCLTIYCTGGGTSTYCDTIAGAATKITRSGAGYTLKIKQGYNTGTAPQPAVTGTLHIYPNPTSNGVYIELPDGLTQAQVSLKNILGQSIDNNTLTDHKSFIDMHTLPTGVYIIEVQGAGKVYMNKVIKQQ